MSANLLLTSGRVKTTHYTSSSMVNSCHRRHVVFKLKCTCSPMHAHRATHRHTSTLGQARAPTRVHQHHRQWQDRECFRLPRNLNKWNTFLWDCGRLSVYSVYTLECLLFVVTMLTYTDAPSWSISHCQRLYRIYINMRYPSLSASLPILHLYTELYEVSDYCQVCIRKSYTHA